MSILDSLISNVVNARLYLRNWRPYARHVGITGDEEWSLTNPTRQLQKDNHSCGIFAMTYIKRLLIGEDLTTIDADEARREIAVFIISNLEISKTHCSICDEKCPKDHEQPTWVSNKIF